jgi:organic hydroperoxide reductase OsmC/OhrA
MLGTLNGGLEARGIKLDSHAIRADVEGHNEMRDKLPVLTRIHVKYRLTVPRESRETVDRLLSKHQEKCPTAQSLAGAVVVTWEADVRDQ